MPGANCAIVGCGTNRATNKVLSFFKIRQPKYPEWQQALLAAVNRCDKSLNINRATICSRHFTPECIKEHMSGWSTLLPGSLPTLWMPTKSVETPKPPPRKAPLEREAPSVPQVVAYYNFGEVRKDANCLPSPWILLKNTEEEIVVVVADDSSFRLKVSITINFTASVFVWGLPTKSQNSTIENTSLSKFLKGLNSLNVCPGVTDLQLQKYAKLPQGQETQHYFKHVIFCINGDGNTDCKTAVHSSECHWLQKSTEPCNPCKYVKVLLLRKHERDIASTLRPLKKRTPLSSVSASKLKERLRSDRRHSKKLQKELNKFKRALAAKPETVQIVAPEMHESLKSVIDMNGDKLQPLQKLFWEEQVKAFRCKSKQAMRWHPNMIRLAILLHSRSPGAYDTLRKTGVLHLPGLSTLQDYTNVSSPQEGFSIQALENIKNAAKDLQDHQRFVVLLHDEMSIKSDLVFDQRTGELIGFVKVEGNKRQLATHVLVFYVVGVSSGVSASMGYFGTTTSTADTIFPLFWKAIGQLEVSCKLKVIASVSDKATQNQRMFDMHGSGNTICYKAKNLYARDREIFFISDPPHLIKTVRNNLCKSGSGKNIRCLWINGQYMLWEHILRVYHRDCGQQLRMTKLTNDHVNLTPASVMNVRLAAQVLSERVGKILQQCGPECQETAKFVLLMDKFFDCMNTRAKNEGMRKRKPNLEPYYDENDDRFVFFEELLQYLINWKQSVQEKEGPTKSEKNKMFLSHQTFKGLYTTLKAFPEAAKYLLSHGVEFVLSNRFCQDPLEAHFGRHRGLGRRCDNPSLWAFGYGENKLRLQRSLALSIQPRGNISQKRQANETFVVSNSPMKKKKRH